MEHIDQAQNVGVFGLFCILLVREILSWIALRERKELHRISPTPPCGFPGGGFEAVQRQVSAICDANIAQRIRDENLTDVVRDLSQNINKQTQLLERLSSEHIQIMDQLSRRG